MQSSNKLLEHFPYEYWLESIRQFDEGKDKSHVFLIENKIDLEEQPQFINQKNLIDKFSNLDFFELSILKAASEDPNYLPAYENFNSILQEKLSKISQKKHIGLGLAAMRKDIEEAKNEFTWNYDEYIDRIKSHEPDISDNDINLFTQYFRDEAGVILYYKNNEKLKDIVFLNPIWVIDSIYNVLNQSVMINNGIFDQEHVSRVNKSGLPTEKLVELMKSFEVIFEDSENANLIAPQFLPDDCPNKLALSLYLKKVTLEPSFTVHFPHFLPRSIMLRFLSQFGSEVSDQLYWKNGIAFIRENNMAYVSCDNSVGKNIDVHVENNNLLLQADLFNAIYELSNKNEQLEVAVNGNKQSVKIEELIRQYLTNNQRVLSQQGNAIDINEFEHLISFVKKPVVKELSIFISYAQEDITYLEEFRDKYLKSIKSHHFSDMKILTDADLTPGMPRNKMIKQFIEQSNIVIFLISQNFASNDYLQEEEIPFVLKRYNEKKQIVIPILIKPVVSAFRVFNESDYLPTGREAINLWPNKDMAWMNVTEGIIQVLDDIQAGRWNDYFD